MTDRREYDISVSDERKAVAFGVLLGTLGAAAILPAAEVAGLPPSITGYLVSAVHLTVFEFTRRQTADYYARHPRHKRQNKP